MILPQAKNEYVLNKNSSATAASPSNRSSGVNMNSNGVGSYKVIGSTNGCAIRAHKQMQPPSFLILPSSPHHNFYQNFKRNLANTSSMSSRSNASLAFSTSQNSAFNQYKPNSLNMVRNDTSTDRELSASSQNQNSSHHPKILQIKYQSSKQQQQQQPAKPAQSDKHMQIPLVSSSSSSCSFSSIKNDTNAAGRPKNNHLNGYLKSARADSSDHLLSDTQIQIHRETESFTENSSSHTYKSSSINNNNSVSRYRSTFSPFFNPTLSENRRNSLCITLRNIESNTDSSEDLVETRATSKINSITLNTSGLNGESSTDILHRNEYDDDDNDITTGTGVVRLSSSDEQNEESSDDDDDVIYPMRIEFEADAPSSFNNMRLNKNAPSSFSKSVQNHKTTVSISMNVGNCDNLSSSTLPNTQNNYESSMPNYILDYDESDSSLAICNENTSNKKSSMMTNTEEVYARPGSKSIVASDSTSSTNSTSHLYIKNKSKTNNETASITSSTKLRSPSNAALNKLDHSHDINIGQRNTNLYAKNDTKSLKSAAYQPLSTHTSNYSLATQYDYIDEIHINKEKKSSTKLLNYSRLPTTPIIMQSSSSINNEKKIYSLVSSTPSRSKTSEVLEKPATEIKNNLPGFASAERHSPSDDLIPMMNDESFYSSFNKNGKRWRSMYALRDSIRNLTSCVSSKSSYAAQQKKNQSTKVLLTSVHSGEKIVDEKPHHHSTDQINLTQSVYDSENDNGGFEEYDEKDNTTQTFLNRSNAHEVDSKLNHGSTSIRSSIKNLFSIRSSKKDLDSNRLSTRSIKTSHDASNSVRDQSHRAPEKIIKESSSKQFNAAASENYSSNYTETGKTIKYCENFKLVNSLSSHKTDSQISIPAGTVEHQLESESSNNKKGNYLKSEFKMLNSPSSRTQVISNNEELMQSYEKNFKKHNSQSHLTALSNTATASNSSLSSAFSDSKTSGLYKSTVSASLNSPVEDYSEDSEAAASSQIQRHSGGVSSQFTSHNTSSKFYNTLTSFENHHSSHQRHSIAACEKPQEIANSSPNSNVIYVTNSTNNKKIKIKRKKNIKQVNNNNNNSNANQAGDNSSLNHSEKNDAENDVLYEMIEKIQGKRFDNQRCELSQDYSVTKFFNKKFPTDAKSNSGKSNDETVNKYSLNNNNNKLNDTLDTNLNSELFERSFEKMPNTNPTMHSNQNGSPLTTANVNAANNVSRAPSVKTSQLVSDRIMQTILDCQSQAEEDKLKSETVYPMICLPDNDNYWSEGWKHSSSGELTVVPPLSSSSSTSSTSSSPSPSPSTQSSASSSSIKQTSSDLGKSSPPQSPAKTITVSTFDFDSISEQSYQEAFIGKEHLMFYGQDDKDSPLILSYKIEQSENGEELKAILRTRETNFCMTTLKSNIEDPITPPKICKHIIPDLRIKFLSPITILNAFKLIRNFDNHTANKNFKFGVIYMKKGQTTEEELFSNQEHSEAFDHFLNLIGQQVELKGFNGFRGGLDNAHGQTGEFSVYETYQNKEIMFHVSTLLPFSKSDSQQLERKRHIGNDIVAIVFQEDNTPFAPDMIASNFLHTFIVVQKFVDEKSSKTKYRVSVVARKDVPNFGPAITHDSVYEHDQVFKEWLLNKLINAEIASYKAEKFRKLKERTRTLLFDNLYNDLHEQNKRVLESMFPSLNLNSMSISSNSEISSSSNAESSSHRTSSMIDSNLLMNSNSGHTGSTTSINGSSSFKLSLLNTVRKAFTKKNDHKESSSGSKPVVANHVIINPNANSSLQSNSFNQLPNSSVAKVPLGGQVQQQLGPAKARNRSSTFDSGSSVFASSSFLNKIQQQQNPNYSVRKLDVLHEKNVSNMSPAKIGSIDALNSLSVRQQLFAPSSNFKSNTKSVNSETRAPPAYDSLQSSAYSPDDEMDEADYKNHHHQHVNSNRDTHFQQNNHLNLNQIEDSEDTGMGSITPNSSGFSAESNEVYSNHFLSQNNPSHQTIPTN